MTAIKKESEVAKVTTLADTDCVRVTLANGQSASIKKSDLMPIIKDEIGKLLGNTDALSTFTNVLVNNGQTLGKATIENLASVVSGENVYFIGGTGLPYNKVLFCRYPKGISGYMHIRITSGFAFNRNDCSSYDIIIYKTIEYKQQFITVHRSIGVETNIMILDDGNYINILLNQHYGNQIIPLIIEKISIYNFKDVEIGNLKGYDSIPEGYTECNYS